MREWDADTEGETLHGEAAVPHSRRSVVPVIFGFVGGAVFWHLVGFWGLVADMVFHGPRAKISVSNSSGQIGSSRSPSDGVLVQWSNDTTDELDAFRQTSRLFRNGECTTLQQDKPGGMIRRVPCPVTAPVASDVASQAQAPDDSWREFGERASDIATGSIPKQNRLSDEASDRPTTAGGWAPSLNVAPNP